MPSSKIPMTPQEEALARFREKIVKKHWGACFECCDYEGMMTIIEDFLLSEISAAEKRVLERVKALAKESGLGEKHCFIDAIEELES